MPSAAALLRIQIEHQLAARIPAALTPAPQPLRARTSLGVPELDALTGGLPLGAVTELSGSAGSGRTALSLAAVAAATRTVHVAAWVDPSNAFDPLSAAASGIALERLLWVRCPAAGDVTPAPPHRSGLRTPHTERVNHGGGSPHPRSEERGLPEAVNALLATPSSYRTDRIRSADQPGTPGAPNRPLASHLPQAATPRHRLCLRIEQAGTDRQPSRRGSYVLQQRELFTASPDRSAPASPIVTAQRTYTDKPWPRIDQALRVTDLLLQAGGFQLIVLDLADIAPQHVTRIPLATWFRFRAAAEHAQSALLVLTQHPATGSSGAMLLRLEPAGEIAETTYYAGLRLSAQLARQRFAARALDTIPLRKPPQGITAAEWSARTYWSGQS